MCIESEHRAKIVKLNNIIYMPIILSIFVVSPRFDHCTSGLHNVIVDQGEL